MPQPSSSDRDVANSNATLNYLTKGRTKSWMTDSPQSKQAAQKAGNPPRVPSVAPHRPKTPPRTRSSPLPAEGETIGVGGRVSRIDATSTDTEQGLPTATRTDASDNAQAPVAPISDTQRQSDNLASDRSSMSLSRSLGEQAHIANSSAHPSPIVLDTEDTQHRPLPSQQRATSDIGISTTTAPTFCEQETRRETAPLTTSTITRNASANPFRRMARSTELPSAPLLAKERCRALLDKFCEPAGRAEPHVGLTDFERERIGALRQAVETEDILFLVIHQLWCVNHHFPDQVPARFRDRPTLAATFRTLDEMWPTMRQLSGETRLFFAQFPAAPDATLLQVPYVLKSGIRQLDEFFDTFVASMAWARDVVDERRYPLLVSELCWTMRITSTMIQLCVFIFCVIRLRPNQRDVCLQRAVKLFKTNIEGWKRVQNQRPAQPMRAQALQAYNDWFIDRYRAIFTLDASFGQGLGPNQSPPLPADSPLHDLDNSPVGLLLQPDFQPIQSTVPPASDQSQMFRAGTHQSRLPARNNAAAYTKHASPQAVSSAMGLGPGPPSVAHSISPSASRHPQTPGSAPHGNLPPVSNTAVNYIQQGSPQLVGPTVGPGPPPSAPVITQSASSRPRTVDDGMHGSIPPTRLKSAAHTTKASPQSVGTTMRPTSSTTARLSVNGSNPHRSSDDQTAKLWHAHLQAPLLRLLDLPFGLNPNQIYQHVATFEVGPYEFNREGPPRMDLGFEMPDARFRQVAKQEWNETLNRSVRSLHPGSTQFRVRSCNLKNVDTQRPAVEQWHKFATAWHPHIYIMFNGQHLELRRKGQYEQDLPVDITGLVRPGTNHLEVFANVLPTDLTPHGYAVAVEMITLSTIVWIRERCNMSTIKADESLAAITSKLSKINDSTSVHHNGEVELLSTARIPLMDSSPGARIFDTPVRGAHCSHSQCFDLNTFLRTRPVYYQSPHKRSTNNEGQSSGLPNIYSNAPDAREPVTQREGLTHLADLDGPSAIDCWACPICGGDASPMNLIVDGFLVEVRKNLASRGLLDTRDIKVMTDGSWVPGERGPLAQGSL